MATLDDAVQTQIRNIEQGTGRSMTEWVALVGASGREKHGEILAWLKTEHGFSHGNANLVPLTVKRGGAAGGGVDPLDAIYVGPKAPLRHFHDRVIALAREFGDDIELAPSQAYVARRRSKQFGTVGPASGGRLEIGMNLKGVEPVGRLEATTGMCTHRVRLSSPDETPRSTAGCARPTTEPDRGLHRHGPTVPRPFVRRGTASTGTGTSERGAAQKRHQNVVWEPVHEAFIANAVLGGTRPDPDLTRAG